MNQLALQYCTSVKQTVFPALGVDSDSTCLRSRVCENANAVVLLQ
jgi:hypothetical protein